MSGRLDSTPNSTLPDLSRFENLALGKPASQSSLSQWSQANDAQGAVNGRRTGRFGFHTGDEAAAWWSVDLQDTHPVRYVVLWNREDTCAERARNLEIEISTDGQDWDVVGRTGSIVIGGTRSNMPFVIACEDRPARFLRIRKTEPGYLHLDEVEVYGFVPERRDPLRDFCLAIGEDVAVLRKSNKNLAAIRFATLGKRPGEVRSISLLPFGRFGNMVIALIHAIHFARQHDIPRIHLDAVNPGRLKTTAMIGGIEFHTGPADPSFGPDLQDRMYYRDGFPRSFEGLDACATLRIAEDCIRPLLQPRFSAGPPQEVPTLHIHLRAGDIFAATKPHPLYVQPPLAFYQRAVRDAVTRLSIRHVVVVYEDMGNPCIGALCDWLTMEGISVSIQSATLEQDVAELLRAKYLVTAFGTFAFPILLLSPWLGHVYAFRGFLDLGKASTPDVLAARGVTLHIVRDPNAGYTRPGNWLNTPEQREMMLRYPIEALRLEE